MDLLRRTKPPWFEHSPEDFPALPWLPMRRTIPPGLGFLKDRVDQELAHVTYDRLEVGPEAKRWQYWKIWRDFQLVVREFAVVARPDVSSERLGDIPDQVAAQFSSTSAHAEATMSLYPPTGSLD